MRFVVIGAGSVGSTLCAKLNSLDHEVTVIDHIPERVRELGSKLRIKAFAGSGASPALLTQAGIENADYLVAVSEVDEINVASCFVCRLITARPKRIARLRTVPLQHEAVSPELVSEYFDLIINPEQAAAEYLINMLGIPGAREILEFGDGKIRVLGLSVSPNSPLANMKLSALKDWPEELPILVVCVMRASKLLVPKGEDKIRVGDVIYVVSLPSKTRLLFELVGKQLHETKRVILWAEDSLGLTLLRALHSRVDNITVLTPSAALKDELENTFRRIKVIKGDGGDQNILIECGVSDCDAFIAATEDDENNALGALLAKRLGAKSIAAFISKQSYGPVVSAVGVDVVVNLRLAAASAIFKHIHHQSVISESELQSEGAGFAQIEWERKMPFIDTPIKNLNLPHGILIAAIERGDEVIIPGGEDKIAAKDRVLIFVLRGALAKLEKLLGFKLELFI